MNNSNVHSQNNDNPIVEAILSTKHILHIKYAKKIHRKSVRLFDNSSIGMHVPIKSYHMALYGELFNS